VGEGGGEGDIEGFEFLKPIIIDTPEFYRSFNGG
jgi:hypothetical protein